MHGQLEKQMKDFPSGKISMKDALEGSTNHLGWGSHGNAHAKLKDIMNEYRKTHLSDPISYNDMANRAIDAIRLSGAALQCSKACLRAQLDAYYKDKCIGNLKPGDGTGPTPKAPEPAQTPDK
jgi:hypothetical protein